MKKLLYITSLVDKQRAKDRSLCYKAEAMLKAFREQGYEGSWVHFDGDRLMLDETEIARYPSMWLFGLTGYYRILKAIRNTSYDVVYIRFACTDPFFIYFLKQLKRKSSSKIILEFAQYPYEPEWKIDTLLKKTALFFDRRYRGKLKKYVDLALTYTDHDSILGIPTLLIQNGIDVSTIDFTGMCDEDRCINLIGVAHLEFWQGYDRVIEGLADYYRNGGEKKVNFHIVGDGAERPKLEKLVKENILADRVIFHGFKMGTELTEVFRKCHVGISTLGGYREEMYTGSALKVREYAARGIPIVLGYRDIGFTGNEQFVFSVPNDNSPIDIEALVCFYSGLSISSEKIREFAVEQLGWGRQLEGVLERI